MNYFHTIDFVWFMICLERYVITVYTVYYNEFSYFKIKVLVWGKNQ